MIELARISKRLCAARLWILLLLLFSTLACNFPVAVQDPYPTADLAEIVRQTVAAGGAAQPPGSTAVPPDSAAPSPAPGSPAAGGENAPAPTQGADGPAPGNYTTQPGDSLAALTRRFAVAAEQIQSPVPLPAGGLVPAGIPLTIPGQPEEPAEALLLFPDGEMIYGPSSLGFSVEETVRAAGGFLASYVEEVDGETLTGAQIIERLAVESSTSPRLLLALLEYRAGWVYGQPASEEQVRLPIGFNVPEYTGLYQELSLATKMAYRGYYAVRSGDPVELRFQNGGRQQLDPRVNAGTAGLMTLLASLTPQPAWPAALTGPDGFLARYTAWFGDPWQRAAQVGPVYPDQVAAPELALPFLPGLRWSFTGGPHPAWLTYSPLGAVDFAPVTGQHGCVVSSAWATAAAPGVVARSANNVVALDLDGDGAEQTGWVIIYLHLANYERIAAGSSVTQDAPLGHPSCEGGAATGTHVHISRKYNGEWVAADGPLPMVLSGWAVRQGSRAYQGELVRGDQVVTAQPNGRSSSIITRDP